MKMVKTRVTTKARKLNAEWLLEEPQNLEHLFSDELREAIDNEILSLILLTELTMKGWIKVPVARRRIEEYITPGWIEQHIHYNFKDFNDCWMFENKDDAVLFALTWT